MITPRGLKTVTSASQIGGIWEDKLSDLSYPSGHLVLETPKDVEEQIKHFMSLYPGFFYAEVPEKDVSKHLEACFNPSVFQQAKELGLFSWVDDVGIDIIS